MRITINEGDHYPSYWTRLKMRTMVGVTGTRSFRVRFIEGYDYPEPADYKGAVSKLFGRGAPMPRMHSVRYGYRRVNGTMELVRFKEHDYVFDIQPLFTVAPGEWSEPMTISGVGAPCISYFGGKHPAPCRITYDLERV